MKKLINRPEDVVRESMEGMALAHGDILAVHSEPGFVFRNWAPAANRADGA